MRIRLMRIRFKGRDMKREQHGFTLLELVIAVIVAGLMAAIALPVYSGAIQRARIAQATADMSRIEPALERFRANGVLPPNLAAVGMDTLIDPWGNPYRYLNIEAGVNRGAVRKDRNLVPINTDYDLYSMGKDGISRPPLTAKPSRDDIVRAGNGAYMGLAEDY